MRIPATVLSRAVGDEEVLLDLESQLYYGLNPAGALIWKGVKDGATAAQMAEAVQREFDVEPQRARRDVEAFLARLAEKGLLRLPRG